MKTIARQFAVFYFKPATLITYMLQSTEYEVGPYLKWFWRTQDFSRVMHRRVLDPTRRASALRWLLRTGILLQISLALLIFAIGIALGDWVIGAAFGLAVLASYPVVWAHIIVVPLLLAKTLIVGPRSAALIAQTEEIFEAHPGVKIAVIGSYGKTTMKELLTTVLGSGLKVAATPGNKNVSISHARFAKSLVGDEDVLIIEYGEGQPGDIARFARLTHPTHAFITGAAAAHLDKYKTVERAAADLFSIKDFVKPEHIYVNAESPAAQPCTSQAFRQYSSTGLGDWKAAYVHTSLDGTDFSLQNGKQKLKLHSGLLGRHQIGPIAAAAVLALKLGVTLEHIQTGVAETMPFEHRLKPYKLGGAWVLDDTYNGNIEGIRAGTNLLSELTATRKWYVTPGLVDQGAETAKIHQEVGQLIAAAHPDIVVLMKNSVTEYIEAGLKTSDFKGELRIETDPLAFYTNLEQFVAHGDLVLMQNDWTDNYA